MTTRKNTKTNTKKKYNNTKKLLKYYKQRNFTHKSFSYFKDNITSYLTPKELSTLKGKNDIFKHLHLKNKNLRNNKLIKSLLKYNQHYYHHKHNIKKLAKEIQKYYHPKPYIFSDDYDLTIYGRKNKQTGYKQLTTRIGCENFSILDLHKIGKHFPFFSVSRIELSPNNQNMLLTIDFVGSQVYHLFIKNIFTNEYKEVPIPHQKMTLTHNIFGNSFGNSSDTNSSQEAMWLDDDNIIYVSINRYYNDHGVYVFNLTNNTHKLIFKVPHGKFIDLSITSSGLYIVAKISDYNSDAIHLIDMDTLMFNTKPLIEGKFSCRYNYIDHENGLWYLQIQDKENDRIQTTTDFKHFTTLFENNNPYEQILDIVYAKDAFLFTLSTLKGIKLYLLKCKALKLLDESEGDYFSLQNYTPIKNEFTVRREKYTCPYAEQIVNIDKMTITPYKSLNMKPKYHETTRYIHSKLKVTLIYKNTPHNSPCLLRGYGCYGTYEYATESEFYYALLERGFVIAIAHLRGGSEYGYWAYDQGRILNKKNTFVDFIKTADYLVAKGITTRDKLAIYGRSAGGLLISASLNMRPDLCKVALVGVPFVTPLKTLSTFQAPLGIETQSELGDPSDPKVKKYIESYEPLKNIQTNATYPNMFIYTNLNDTLAPYSEGLVYYKTMRELECYKSKQRDISFYLDTRFGHHQGSLLKDKSEHYAILFNYVLRFIN
jgi:protease II